MTPPYKFDALAQLVAGKLATPVFSSEGAYGAAAALNKQFAVPGPHTTPLSPPQEAAFQVWAAANRVPVTPDYDMRGYFLASKGAPHQSGTHFPDTYKTPLDTSFSNESRYAKPTAPAWIGDRLVNQQTQQTVFADKPAPPSRQQIGAALQAIRALLSQ